MSPSLLAIVILPLAVYFLSETLVGRFGLPTGYLPEGHPQFNGHEEGGGRYQTLATFLLFIGAAVAAIAYFAGALSRLDKLSRRWAGGAYIGLAATGLVLLFGRPATWPPIIQTQELVGQQFVCGALAFPDRTPRPPKRRSWDSAPQVPDRCRGGSYDILRSLVRIESVFLLFAIPAVAIGAITSLAWSRRTLRPRGYETLRRHRFEQLNTFLYLSAFLLVTGLLFLSAFLHWPAFALPPELRPQYRAHVGAIVLFHGVTYSLLLAAYYVPVAALLSRRWAKSGPVESGKDKESVPTMLSFASTLRVGAAVFAPVIVSLLGEVMKLPL